MQKYVITSYVPSIEGKINEPFLSSLKNYCKVNEAELFVYRTKAIWLGDEEDTKYSDTKPIKFINSNLYVSDLLLSPTTQDPLAGIDGLVSKNGNLIIPFSNQRFKVIARSIKKYEHPRAVWCTGTISKPLYPTTKVGYRAKSNHLCGALVVEVKDNKYFNIRQLQANIDGTFYDGKKLYTPKRVIDSSIAGLVMGDIHPFFLDSFAFNETLKLIKELQPEELIYHDLFDSTSISHHLKEKFVTKAIVAKEIPSLEHEGLLTASILRKLIEASSKLTKHIIVKSNHDEHLDRYLDEFRFKEDYTNLILALDLCKQMVLFKQNKTNVGPLQKLLSEHITDFSNVTFLRRNNVHNIAGIECSNHGDIGNNGARGSIKSQGLILGGKVVTGHSHSPEITSSGNFSVGTLTKLQMPYTDASGGSTWMHSNVIIYPSGTMTHIHMVE